MTSIDFATTVGQVRALIPDIEMIADGTGNEDYLFTDEHITAILGLNRNSPKRAAADCIEAIAMSEALISKVIKTEDLSTDGAKLMNAMVNRAAQLRRSADADDSLNKEDSFIVVGPLTGRPWWCS